MMYTSVLVAIKIYSHNPGFPFCKIYIFLCFRHEMTFHLFYLQLRQDILNGYTYCSDEVLLILASCALQAEYGTYQPEYHGTEYFRLEHYLPGRVETYLPFSSIGKTIGQ